MLELSYDARAVSVVEEVLQKKLAKVIAAAGSPRRLYSTRGRSGPDPAPLKRALSVHSAGGPKHELATLKCLTVIVYLCQYGSGAFMQWLRAHYRTLVQPLARLAFLPQYSHAIYLKVSLVVRYCESSSELASCRHSVDEIRQGIKPGLVGAPRSPPTLPTRLAPLRLSLSKLVGLPYVALAQAAARTGSPRQDNLLPMIDGTMRLSSKNPFMGHV